ncbi:putative vacuolar membrane transporter for cationic amino acids [Coemansia pectinata]|uniref:Vacuolar membrane transporter for cationic amino acids n=1 Tax=Coemansia pectinata TaxID=1052879 RepID=A0A9W8GUQ3_9FUNG|nr:putative vacuolar membrane transporter for cationic amino acids [Coemansia pectinata]
MAWNELVSEALGYFSIGCWLIVFAPQIYENYQRKSGESISLSFLYIWILGDVFGLVGGIQQGLIVTALILYIYYFVADAVLLAQIHYYRYINRRAARGLVLESEREPLFIASDQSEATEAASTRLSASLLLPLLAVLLLGSTTASLVGGSIRAKTLLQLHPLARLASVPTKPQLVPQVLGYISALLFLGARIPQLAKNYRKQSCEGLSIGMFTFSILGNTAFTLSLLLHSLDNDYLLANIPWIIGSTGTLVFDLAIFYQFHLYHVGDTPSILSADEGEVQQIV